MYRNTRQPHLMLPASIPAWSVQAGDVIRIDPHEVPGDGHAPGHGPAEITRTGTVRGRDDRSPLTCLSWQAGTAAGIAFYALRAGIILLAAGPARRSIRPEQLGLGPC